MEQAETAVSSVISGQRIILQAPWLTTGMRENISTSILIDSVPAKGTVLTGNVFLSLKKEGESYLTIGEKSVDAVPLGDSVVFEGLFEMDDGTYKNFADAGITKIMIGDQRVALLGGKTSDGAYRLILNKEGKTGTVMNGMACQAKVVVEEENVLHYLLKKIDLID